MFDKFFLLFEKLLVLAGQFFIYRAGQHSAQQDREQDTLDEIAIAKHVATDTGRLDADTVRQRLREQWTRQ